MRCSRATLPLVFAVAAAVALAEPSPVFAQKPTAAANDHERALDLFKRSKALYEKGQFREAIALLEQAYALEPAPTLLFNLGRAYESAGELDAAVDAYRRYLKSDPKAKDKGAIEQRIETLTRQIEERNALERERDAASARAARAEKQPRSGPPPVRERPTGERGPGALPWIVAGSGVALIGAGAVLGVLAKARHADAEDAPNAKRAQEEQDSAERFATFANVGFVAGGVLVVGGLTWALLSRPRDGAREREGLREPRRGSFGVDLGARSATLDYRAAF